jgi:hypothetical protein
LESCKTAGVWQFLAWKSEKLCCWEMFPVCLMHCNKNILQHIIYFLQTSSFLLPHYICMYTHTRNTCVYYSECVEVMISIFWQCISLSEHLHHVLKQFSFDHLVYLHMVLIIKPDTDSFSYYHVSQWCGIALICWHI